MTQDGVRVQRATLCTAIDRTGAAACAKGQKLPSERQVPCLPRLVWWSASPAACFACQWSVGLQSASQARYPGSPRSSRDSSLLQIITASGKRRMRGGSSNSSARRWALPGCGAAPHWQHTGRETRRAKGDTPHLLPAWRVRQHTQQKQQAMAGRRTGTAHQSVLLMASKPGRAAGSSCQQLRMRAR